MNFVANLIQRDGLRARLQTVHAYNSEVPRLDVTLIEDKGVRKRAERLLRGRDGVVAGLPMQECADIAKCHLRWFERILNRYLTLTDDGTLLGERAFLRDVRAKRHPERTKEPAPGAPAWGGSSGLFLKLVKDNKPFNEDLVQSLRRMGKQALEPNHLVGRELRKLIERLCIKHGVKDDEYPLNTQDKGLRACRRWMVTDFLPGYASDWIANEAGPNAAKAMTTPQLKPTIVTEFEVYIEWVIDECTVDVRTKVELINAAGDLDIVERKTFDAIRVVELGYNTTLATWPVWSDKATAYDLGNLVWRALNGWTLPDVLPELQVDPGGGFPVNELPELRWKAPRRIYLDNTLAHLGVVFGVIASHVLGAELRLGRPASPKERPVIESKFSLTARRLIHQLPGTTGSGPKDPQRARHEDLEADKLLCADHVEKAMTVLAANENGVPSTAAHGIPALERLRRAVLRGAIHAAPVALGNRVRHMFFPGKEVRVHVDFEHGRKPFVNFERVRYSSPQLQKRYDLANKMVLARFDPDDLRGIILFSMDGLEICRAAAEGRWGLIPNDMRMRKMTQKAIDKAAFGRMPQDGPLTALFATLQREAPTSPSAAARLAHCISVIGRHMLNAVSNPAEWVAKLFAEGESIEAAAMCRPAANGPSMEGDEAAAQHASALQGVPPPSSSGMQPRNAIRRIA